MCDKPRVIKIKDYKSKCFIFVSKTFNYTDITTFLIQLVIQNYIYITDMKFPKSSV